MTDEHDGVMGEAMDEIESIGEGAEQRASATEFGGHEFEYESSTDLFRCSECRVYEVQARDRKTGTIAPCKGLAGYGDDTERVYLLLTENPALTPSYGTSLAWRVRETGIGRPPRFAFREGKMLIESAPSVVDDLARRIDAIAFDVGGLRVPAVTSIDRLTAEEGQAIIAANRAAYIAEYGEDA